METLTEICKRLEHFETPEWAINAILKRETLTSAVLDPCAGSGIMSEKAHGAGYQTHSIDIHDWGYPAQTAVQDFLEVEKFYCDDRDFTVFMNPPFSKACEFVEKSFELGARKIVCFQRFAWWESRSRREFWKKYPPSRVYICGDRASCWRHDIPESERGSGTPTAHAWFVWDRIWPNEGTLLSHIWKDEA